MDLPKIMVRFADGYRPTEMQQYRVNVMSTGTPGENE